MTIPLIQNLSIREKTVLVRVDFNVPFTLQKNISDLTRIEESLPSIQFLLKNNAKIILLSHLGRPSKKDPSYSLKPCAEALGKLLEKKVFFAEDCLAQTTKNQINQLSFGNVLLLENLRFYEAEENPQIDPQFAKTLASYGDFYINDAFGAAHRVHSSIVPIVQYFPQKAGAGFLLQKEIEALKPFTDHPKRPFHLILGGAKMSSKLKIIQAFLEKADAIYCGGAMAFTFLKAQGLSIGDSLYEPELVPMAQKILSQHANPFYLPLDLIITNGQKTQTILLPQDIPPGWRAVDIGPATLAFWENNLLKAQSIFWNGPLGLIEQKEFAQGSYSLARFLATLPSERVIGGGDSTQIIKNLNIQNKFTHISTGGGASLEYLEQGTLPGLEALKVNFLQK